MTRLFAGVKPGVGPVLKVMANNVDDPLTTPNTDYHKYRFNSETAAIGYGDHVFEWVIPSTGYSWPAGTQTLDISSALRVVLRNISTGYFMEPQARFEQLYPKANLFPYVVDRSANYRPVHRCFDANYPGTFGDWYQLSQRRLPLGSVFGTLLQRKTLPAGTIQWLPNSGNYSLILPGGTGNYTAIGNMYTSGPLPDPGYFSSENMSFDFYYLDLPIDDTPYPAVTGSFAAGKKILRLDPTTAKMAKPGFDVDAASADQLIFDGDKLPMKVVKTGSFTLASGATQTIPLGAAYDTGILVDYQVNKVGEDLWVPPWPSIANEVINVRYRINGTDLQFQNAGPASVVVRYFVMAEDRLAPSVGTAKVVEVGADYALIRRPGSAGTRLRDTIIDTRMSYLPIVAQGWVPFASFVASDFATIGTHMHVVNLSNGGFKPFVVAMLSRSRKDDPNLIDYFLPYGLWINNNSYFGDNSFMIRVSDSQIKFYCSDGSRLIQSYRNDQGQYQLINSQHDTVGLRYYVFAIPTSL
ncbi:MAG: hypothetical protein K5872_08840 [Rhizobiaceae bacterium]|nr:hypothetical protein [Rhizobiaceae bacterium]MCV0406321.1 hypothetical protein [Rhizobiaceae bacterium]